MRGAEPADYVLSGVRLRSTIPLGTPVGRATEEGAAVTVEAGVVEAPALEPGVDADWLVRDGSLILQVRGVARFEATGGRRVIIDAEPGASSEDLRLYVSGSVLGAIWLQRGLLPLHASAVEIPGGGCVAFIGAMGAGKSSLAAHMAVTGFPLVTDDVSVLAERDGGFGVWPGPSRVKLGPDTLASLDHESTGLAPAGGTRGKYHLEVRGAASTNAAPVRLRSIFLLSWGEGDGAARTERLSGLNAVDAVAGHTYRQEFVRPLGLESTWLRQVVEVARIVPTMRLIRPHGFERTDAVIQAVVKATQEAEKAEVDR
jgi:hypothetical protein